MKAENAPDADIEIATWGDPAEWRDFFKERQLRRDFPASLTLRDRCVYVSHGDFECQMASPRMDGRTVSFLSYPWMDSRGEMPHGRLQVAAALSTDLDENDVVMGGAGKLDALLRSVARETPREILVALVPDCVPLMTGEDVEGVIRRRARDLGRRLVYLNLAADPRTTLFERLFEKVRAEEGPRRRGRRGGVNLVGFPDNDGTRELTRLLAACGVRVNARLLPDFSVAEMRRWPDAALQVFLPHSMLEPVYRRAFAGVALPAIAPAAPYGFAGTRRWLGAVLEALGARRAGGEPWAAGAARAQEEFLRLKRGLGPAVLAIVDDAAGLPRYSDPSRTCGVPLVAFLREMGVGIRFLVHRGSARAAAPRRGVEWFSSPEQLERLLRGGEFQGVFSNVFFDRRVTRAGKTPFSLQPFEMGFSGAVRTLRRIAGICGWDFYAKNAKSLRG